MADERDDQATQVGHSVVSEEDAQETEVHAGQPKATDESGAPIAPAESPAGADPEGSARTEAFVQTAQPSAEQQEAAPTPPAPQDEPRAPSSPAEADRMAADEHDPFNEKPHLYALGVFTGAFVIAQILKRITGGDD
jgi:hypothetical protein